MASRIPNHCPDDTIRVRRVPVRTQASERMLATKEQSLTANRYWKNPPATCSIKYLITGIERTARLLMQN